MKNLIKWLIPNPQLMVAMPVGNGFEMRKVKETDPQTEQRKRMFSFKALTELDPLKLFSKTGLPLFGGGDSSSAPAATPAAATAAPVLDQASQAALANDTAPPSAKPAPNSAAASPGAMASYMTVSSPDPMNNAATSATGSGTMKKYLGT